MDIDLITRRVAVVIDDHKLFASVFAMQFERMGFFASVHAFSTEKEITDFLLHNTIPNVWLFVDYFIPGVNTDYLISDVRKICPGARIAIVSGITNVSLIRRILTFKIEGLISKSDGVGAVLAYIQQDNPKTCYLSSYIVELLSAAEPNGEHPSFTARELEVLSLISNGKRIGEISELLNLSKHTIITYRRNLLTKSGFRSITELVADSIKSGLVNMI